MARAKGTKNFKSYDANALATKMGVDPLKIMLMFAAGDWKGLGYDGETYFSEKADGSTKLGYTIPPELRMQAAKDSAKYLYSPKPQSVEHSAPQGIKLIIEDYTGK